jgi:hypothetical protein
LPAQTKDLPLHSPMTARGFPFSGPPLRVRGGLGSRHSRTPRPARFPFAKDVICPCSELADFRRPEACQLILDLRRLLFKIDSCQDFGG